jgi:hypothetical protein
MWKPVQLGALRLAQETAQGAITPKAVFWSRQSLLRSSDGGSKFEVIACIDGRGFRIRRERMRTLIEATQGKVFTLATLQHLVKRTGLRRFAGQAKRRDEEGSLFD